MVDAVPHCIVTGSASGIGLALVRRLLADGWSISGLDRQRHPDDIEATIEARRVDLTDLEAVAAVASNLKKKTITAFVHCAGIMRADDDPHTREDGGATLWRLHVGSAERLIREITPVLPANAGRIVLVSSRALLGRSGRALYAASKSAMTGLARSWAAELVTHGITVNVVAPGATDTPMLIDPERRNAPVRSLPIGRLIQANEVAALITFLLGRDAGAITGQTIFICGGASLSDTPVGQPPPRGHHAL